MMTGHRPYNLLVILGPTATGKTALSVRLARWLVSRHSIPCEIMAADSRQVYRGMDLGTGKDLQDFIEGGDPVPCHLVDLVDPQYEFNLYEYRKAFDSTLAAIRGRGAWPILVGGTGLYIESVTADYDLPDALGDKSSGREAELMSRSMDELKRHFLELRKEPPHNRTDLEDKRRLARAIIIEEKRREMPGPAGRKGSDLRPLMVGIRTERVLLRQRIGKRLLERIEQGMIDEVRLLKEEGITWERLDSFGLEYRYVSRYLRGEMTRDEMVQTLAVKIGQFAKRQETWFRRMERRGAFIHWIEAEDFESLKELVEGTIVHDAPHE